VFDHVAAPWAGKRIGATRPATFPTAGIPPGSPAPCKGGGTCALRRVELGGGPPSSKSGPQDRAHPCGSMADRRLVCGIGDWGRGLGLDGCVYTSRATARTHTAFLSTLAPWGVVAAKALNVAGKAIDRSVLRPESKGPGTTRSVTRSAMRRSFRHGNLVHGSLMNARMPARTTWAITREVNKDLKEILTVDR
jgi:hypothetical protein